MVRNRTKRLEWLGAWALIGGLIQLSGCASAPPSKELLDARAAYQRALSSQSRELVPDRLLEAKQALERAEAAHADSGGDREKTLAYIAQRRAALAVAEAGKASAKREVEGADEELRGSTRAARAVLQSAKRR